MTDLDNKIKELNIELIRACCTALNTSTLTRAGLSHGVAVMQETIKLCKDNGDNRKVNAKKYRYLLNKIEEFDRTFCTLVTSLEKTLGVEGVSKGFEDTVTEAYSDLYDKIEIDTKELDEAK